MKVVLRNPNREIELDGRFTVNALIARLELNRESVLVIENGVLVPGDRTLDPSATVEVRSVISGGEGPTRPATASSDSAGNNAS